MIQPRLLDLFCKAGGATKGYQRAGFYVVGVDVEPQPNYCGDKFIQADALTFPLDGFDAYHASPPCHDYSTATAVDRALNGDKDTAWMLPAIRARLRRIGHPYVIENVETARRVMRNPTRLCGSSFGLDVRRHRLFETNWSLKGLPCDHSWQTPRFISLFSGARRTGRLASVVGVHGSTQYKGDFEVRCAAMRINWMTLHELNQAIPPAYTKYIGKQLIREVIR